MRKLTSRWVIATLSITIMLFAAGTLDAGALDEPQEGQQKQRQGKKGGNGGGGGGPGGGDSSTYAVTVDYNGVLNGPATGTADDAYAIRENEDPSNPAPDYWLGAQVVAPQPGNNVIMTITFADVDGTSCTDFFVTNGHVGSSVTNAENHTWTGPVNARILLDEGLSVDDPQKGWADLGTTGGRAAKVRINGNAQTTRERGKKTITENVLLFSLRFDADWEPDGDTNSDIYAALGDRADDLWATGNGTVSTVTGGPGALALVHTIDTPADAALCSFPSISWTVTAQ